MRINYDQDTKVSRIRGLFNRIIQTTYYFLPTGKEKEFFTDLYNLYSYLHKYGFRITKQAVGRMLRLMSAQQLTFIFLWVIERQS